MIAGVRLICLRGRPRPPPETGRRLPLSLLASEFPTLTFTAAIDPGRCDVLFEVDEWEGAPRFEPWDAQMNASTRELGVRGRGGAGSRAAMEILTRYQRFIGRRNEASDHALFDRILALHAEAYAVIADFDHAIDTWQWMLRLEPDASLAAQVAALFHDIERLAGDILRRAGADAALLARVQELIAGEQRRGDDPEGRLLNDADALSFFSLNSAGYADHFGAEQARRKVRFTLQRLHPRRRDRLSTVRLRDDVAAFVHGELPWTAPIKKGLWR